jgi:hypothetical protein
MSPCGLRVAAVLKLVIAFRAGGKESSEHEEKIGKELPSVADANL